MIGEANPETANAPDSTQRQPENTQSDMGNWLKQEMDRMCAEMMFSRYGQNMHQPQIDSYHQSFPTQAPSENNK